MSIPKTLPAWLLRLEGLTALISAVAVYAHLRGDGWLFALLLLAPDLAALGYLVNPRVGAWAYNAAHTYAAPAALLAFGVGSGTLLAAQIALIWFAHIGMDRTVGYGLKFSDSAKHTHLS
jgi:hypothetical protein